METPRSRQAARLRSADGAPSSGRAAIVVLAVVGAFAIVTLVLTAFGSSGSQPVSTGAAGAFTPPSGSTPRPESVATVSNLSIKLPVAQDAVTAIGFHASTDSCARAEAARPPDQRGAAGAALAQDLRLREERAGLVSAPGRLRAPATAVLDVGAAPGTFVYAPVDGTVASISDTILNGAQPRLPDRHPPDRRRRR